MWGLVRSNFCLAIIFLRKIIYRVTFDLRLLSHNRLGDCDWYFLVAVELHGERRATLGLRPEVGRVAEHRRERDVSANRLRVPARLQAFDPAAARAQGAHDVAQALLGGHDLGADDGREELGVRWAHRRLEGERAGPLEPPLAGVEVGVRRLDALDADVHD